MNKRILLLALLTLAVGGAVAVYTHSWNNFWNTYKTGPATDAQLAAFATTLGRTNMPTQPVPVPLDLSKPVRLAIGGLGLADNDQNQQLGDLVTADLTGAPGFDLVERQSLDAILRELNLSLSGFVRAKDAVRVGKLLKADWFLLGTESKIHETNSIVVRVVDARTGIMRDAGVFPCDKPPDQLAADLAAFARQTRQNAATGKTRVYLAIGAFEDLSLNNRQADFPTQLRGYLTAAYQGSGVTLLEREYVETLLNEVHLDLAGLTDDSGTNPPSPMQSAFWLVSGQYQSYETTNFQVELSLDVEQIFGRGIVVGKKLVVLRDQPGDPIFKKVKQAIDGKISKSVTSLAPTRFTEADAQMAVGKDLIHFLDNSSGDLDIVNVYANWDMDPQQAAIQKRNVEEAMRAFETVLLLEPSNREAKMCLAACLRTTTFNRLDDARNYYREIIEEQGQDKWTGLARQALLKTFERFWWGGPTQDEEARWFESAALHATNPPAVEFFRSQAEAVRADIAIKSDASEEEKLVETNLFKSVRAFEGFMHSGSGWGSSGMADFIRTFGTNEAAAARRITELLPELKSQTPDLGPYLLAEAVSYQVDTNAPVIAEFQTQFAKISERPSQVLAPNIYWNLLGDKVYDWSMEHKFYDLAAKLMEGKFQAAANFTNHVIWNIDDDDKMRLAFAYLGTQQWEKALKIFETYPNKPLQMVGVGPWGHNYNSMIFPAKEANYCRQKLGLPAVIDPREFSIGKPVLCFCNPSDAPSTFIADDNGLWLGIGGQLLHLDFDLKTNLVINLPMDASTPITALCLTSSNIWIGTGGDGLIDFDKTSHQCRLLAEKDGLLMENIASLQISKNTLWIGYGRIWTVDGYRIFRISGSVPYTQPGGLGKLDLTTGRIVSFIPSLLVTEKSNSEKPTDKTVMAMAAGTADDIWFLTVEYDPAPHLHRLQSRNNLLEGFQNECTALAGNQKQIALAQFVSPTLSIMDLKDGQWRSLKGAAELPSSLVSTMTLDGNNLWVGGMGYIALMDTVQDKVLRFADVNTANLNSVELIQIGGGYVWVQYDWHLYRASLSDIQ